LIVVISARWRQAPLDIPETIRLLKCLSTSHRQQTRIENGGLRMVKLHWLIQSSLRPSDFPRARQSFWSQRRPLFLFAVECLQRVWWDHGYDEFDNN
jgi:hypothetical protein